jgi:hypothetical protein
MKAFRIKVSGIEYVCLDDVDRIAAVVNNSVKAFLRMCNSEDPSKCLPFRKVLEVNGDIYALSMITSFCEWNSLTISVPNDVQKIVGYRIGWNPLLGIVFESDSKLRL